MGRLGWNSGYIGSDQRTGTTGAVGLDKYYLERVNNRFFPSLSYLGILDQYPGASVAFSLRKLTANYIGPAIRVRRSSDSAEQNIGFDSNGNLDTSLLLSFCGVGNGFVTIWYDQSGNGYNVIQNTAANQPQIVSNGSILSINNRPAIYSNQKFLQNSTNPSLSTPVTDFFAYKTNSVLGNSFQTYYDGGSVENRRGYFGLQLSNLNDIQYQGTIMNGWVYTLNLTLATIVRNSTSSQMYKNNVLQSTGNSGTYNLLIGLTFGVDYDTLVDFSDVYYQEFIRYSGVSSNISPINTNINLYYGIY